MPINKPHLCIVDLGFVLIRLIASHTVNYISHDFAIPFKRYPSYTDPNHCAKKKYVNLPLLHIISMIDVFIFFMSLGFNRTELMVKSNATHNELLRVKLQKMIKRARMIKERHWHVHGYGPWFTHQQQCLKGEKQSNHSLLRCAIH